ncbi:MAG: acyl-CoA dehydrogenase family protein [Candidatus Rokubacteria bacterium]|nr:acyl-CoA dehydrogenase family protein [Candidatus Rokubacteria bacterium]
MAGEDIYGSSEHQAFRAAVRKLVQTELVPRAREFDEMGRPDKAIFRRLGEMGLLGIRYEPKYGGQGLDYSYHAVFLEELALCDNARPTWRRPRSRASAARRSRSSTSCPRSGASRSPRSR